MNLKFNGKKEQSSLIRNNLFNFIRNSFQELIFFRNFKIIKNDDEIKTSKNNKIEEDNTENFSYNNLIGIYKSLNSNNYIKNYDSNKVNPLDLLVSRIVKTMVDTICYRASNGDEIKNIIPLVPKTESDFYKPAFRKVKLLKIVNENNYLSGFFGWCFICRKPANFYCISHRLPICSFECKNNLLLEEKQLAF